MEQAQLKPAAKRCPDAARWCWLTAILLLFLAGCAIRFWNLGQESLWFDEGYTAWVVSLQPTRIVDVIRHDASPPLYYLLLKQWTDLFGDSETALRAMSALASCLTIAVTGAIAWHLTGRLAGVLAAVAVISLNVLQIQYAQEARSYGLASLLMALAIYAGVRRMSGSAAWLLPVLVTLAAGVYLHNMMWFYVAGFCLAYLIMPGPMPLLRRITELAALCAGILAIYAWWIPALMGQIRWLQGNFWAMVPGWAELAQVLVAAGGMKLMHLSAIPFGSAAGWISAMVLIGVCLAALAGRSRDHFRWAAAILVLGLVPIAAVYGYAQVSQSYFVEKIFTASSMTIALLVALAIRSRGRLAMAALLPLILLGSGVSVWGYFQREQKEDWRSAVAHVDSIPREGTLVVFVANEGELLYDYYLRRSGGFAHELTGAPQGFHELQPPKTIQRVLSDHDTQRLAAILREERPQRVVLVLSHTHFSDPQMLTRKLLEQEMRLVRESAFNLVDVIEFER